jgi:hypothetical protein
MQKVEYWSLDIKKSGNRGRSDKGYHNAVRYEKDALVFYYIIE